MRVIVCNPEKDSEKPRSNSLLEDIARWYGFHEEDIDLSEFIIAEDKDEEE